MKQILIIILLVLGYLSYSQESYFVEGKGYYGYVFSKDRSLNGFPPESNRYNLTQEDIVQAEAFLKDNINTEYVQSSLLWGLSSPVNKRTLKKYYRQYIGYLNSDNEVIVRVNLTKCVWEVNELSDDLIVALGGGSAFWEIYINLHTKQVFGLDVNGPF